MIAIASGSAPESAALASLCDHHGWNVVECQSVRAVKRLIRRTRLRVMLARYQLPDGYSDEVIASLTAAQGATATKIIILLTAGTSSSIEARQLRLGADCVLRDPIRADVLMAYLEKYLRTASRRGTAPLSRRIKFLDATLNRLERTLQRRGRTVVLTPREVMLVELLSESVGDIVTYEVLYNEILGRSFAGDTSNMRVLFAKLTTSALQIGLSVRRAVEVIPKTGYRMGAHNSTLPGSSQGSKVLDGDVNVLAVTEK